MFGKPRRRLKFWPLLGMILAIDLVLVLLYTLLVPGLTRRALSDAFCASAVWLGALSGLPLLFDAGRGIVFAAEVSDDPELNSTHKAFEKERQRREQGMVITFAFVAATFIAFVISFLMEML